jgi:hypothetical protein
MRSGCFPDRSFNVLAVCTHESQQFVAGAVWFGLYPKSSVGDPHWEQLGRKMESHCAAVIAIMSLS